MTQTMSVRNAVAKLQGEQCHYSENEIREMLLKSQLAVERGILAIYEKQTTSEQASERTLLHNQMGFSAFHAKRGSYYAKWLKSGKKLSGRHVEKGRTLILHYTTQLTKIANKEL